MSPQKIAHFGWKVFAVVVSIGKTYLSISKLSNKIGIENTSPAITLKVITMLLSCTFKATQIKLTQASLGKCYMISYSSGALLDVIMYGLTLYEIKKKNKTISQVIAIAASVIIALQNLNNARKKHGAVNNESKTLWFCVDTLSALAKSVASYNSIKNSNFAGQSLDIFVIPIIFLSFLIRFVILEVQTDAHNENGNSKHTNGHSKQSCLTNAILWVIVALGYVCYITGDTGVYMQDKPKEFCWAFFAADLFAYAAIPKKAHHAASSIFTKYCGKKQTEEEALTDPLTHDLSAAEQGENGSEAVIATSQVK